MDHSANSITDALKIELALMRQHLICEEIAKEYEALVFQYKLKLKKPCFALSESLTTLGSWNPLSRTLTLSLHAINSLSWDSVVSLLKHEMAHQIVDEVYLSDDLHGQRFQMACDRIGLLPPFRKAHIQIDELREQLFQDQCIPPELKRRLSKIEKLSALSQSNNEYEANLALKRLQEIKDDLLQFDYQSLAKDSFIRRVISLNKKKVTKIQQIAANILVTYFNVEVIYSSEFHYNRLERTKTLVLLGRFHLVEMAIYVFEFVLAEVERLWQNHKSEFESNSHCSKGQKSAADANAFKIGALLGFEKALCDKERHSKIKQENKEHNVAEPHFNQLVIAEKDRLDDFVQAQFPRLNRKKSNHSLKNSQALNAGKKAGKDITLNTPFQNSKTATLYLL